MQEKTTWNKYIKLLTVFFGGVGFWVSFSFFYVIFFVFNFVNN